MTDEGIWGRDRLTPLGVEPVTTGEGDTPLVSLSDSAEEYDAESLYVKDESRNPTSSVYDRAASAGVSVASKNGAEAVSLYSPGNSAVSVASYAGRAVLDCTVYVPARARFDVKAMVNVHGASMEVGGKDLRDARNRFKGEGDTDAYSLSPFDEPALVDGLATVGDEIEGATEVGADAVVCPVGTGELLVALDESLDGDTHLYAAQPEGCAPLVDNVETPDTVVGELEDPAPPELGRLREVVESRDGVVTVTDGEALDACLNGAREGVSLSPAGGVTLAALSGIDADGSVVVVNPSSGRLHADALRNRMVYHGE